VVSANDGAVDHLQSIGIIATIGQGLQQHIPKARGGPAPVLPVDRVPLAQLRWQITPGNAGPHYPEDGIQPSAVTTWRTAAEGTCLDY
jgi:hypothetical protein